MNDILKFEFENNENLEYIELNGKPLFNPYTIGECLEMTHEAVKKFVQRMSDNKKILIKNSDGTNSPHRKFNNAGELFITESGLYNLIFRSRAKKAEKFQDWVTDKVLPSIRKTGKYESELENQNVLTRQLLDNMTRNLEQLTGVRTEEMAITQNESWNKRLSNLMIDCSTRGLGTIRELYNELFYASL
ncbi:MAG: hypothetical protein K8E24_009565 [Methanobacterium paludis]|nr:hypothetical protein [Methanobacterium paludis]